MGVYYSVYAEANVGGKWYSLCPSFICNGKHSKPNSLFWAQSVFWEVSNYLEGFSLGCGVPDDMSEGLREIFHEDLQSEMENWGFPITWEKYYKNSLFYVNFEQALFPRVNKEKPFKYEGYVLKEELAEIEVYEREEFSEWLTQVRADMQEAMDYGRKNPDPIAQARWKGFHYAGSEPTLEEFILWVASIAKNNPSAIDSQKV